MRYRNILLIATVAGIAGLLIANANKAVPQPTDAPHVATTIFPLYDIVQNVAPDEIAVTQMMPVGANPHTYEPTPSLIESLEGVDAIFSIGYGIDGWTANMPVIPTSVSSNIALRKGEAHEEDVGEDSDAESIDPHYWLTIPNAEKIAANVADTLISHYPQLEPQITANLQAYIAELNEADAAIRTYVAQMQNRNVVTMHDAWYYFAEEYNVTIAGTFEPSAGKEPTPQYLAELMRKIKETGVRTIYIEAGSADDALTAFAEENGLTILELDAEGVRTQTSFIDLMIANAQAFSQNR